MRSASVLVVIVLAAGCTTSAPPGDDGPSERVVVLAQEHAAGFRAGSTEDQGERREEDAPPVLTPDGTPPPGEPPPPESSTPPTPPPAYREGSGGSTTIAYDDSPRPQRLRFTLGPDGRPGPYVSSITLDEDASSFSASLRVVSEATTRMDALVTLENPTAGPLTAVLHGPHIADTRVHAARLLAAGSAADLLVPDAQITLQLAPGARVDVGLELTIGTTPSGETLPTWTVHMDVSGS